MRKSIKLFIVFFSLFIVELFNISLPPSKDKRCEGRKFLFLAPRTTIDRSDFDILKAWYLYLGIRNIYHDQAENLDVISILIEDIIEKTNKHSPDEQKTIRNLKKAHERFQRLSKDFKIYKDKAIGITSIGDIETEPLVQELERLLRESLETSFEDFPESEELIKIRRCHKAFNSSVQDVIDTVKKPPELSFVNLNEVIIEAGRKEGSRAALDLKSVRLTLDLSDNKRITNFPVHHRNLWLYVFRNLFRNAGQHAFGWKLQEDSELVISSKVEKDYIRIIFSDNGKGMPDGALDVVDEKTGKQRAFLEQFSKWKDNERPWHGLGLALVWDIVALHNGEIKVDSKPNAGTTFTIFLPIDRENLKRAEYYLAKVKGAVEITREFDKVQQELLSEPSALPIIEYLIAGLKKDKDTEKTDRYDEALSLIRALRRSVQIIRGEPIVSEVVPLLASL